MNKKNGVFISGIPISSKIKLIIFAVLFSLLIINLVIPRITSSLDYPGRNVVSIILVILAVLISIGSKFVEGIVIGITIFAISSNLWDFAVLDTSMLRTGILIGIIIILVFELVFGRISLINLISIIKSQLGVYKNG